MLADTGDLLHQAQADSYALGAFNTYNLEITRAIIAAAEAKQAPIILQTGASALRYASFPVLSALVLVAAEVAAVPVGVHLDHSHDLDEAERCLKAGYTSIMLDGSDQSFAENVQLTRDGVALAETCGATLEAELGAIVGEEDRSGTVVGKIPMTDPEQAEQFVDATAAGTLAVAIGNAHGLYKGDPKLDFARLRKIRERVRVPLVLHGASGLPDEAIRQASRLGVCKFNVNTEIRVALFHALSEGVGLDEGAYDLPALMRPAMAAMQQVVEGKIELFGSAGKA